MDVKDMLLGAAASVNLACYANTWKQENNAVPVAVYMDIENKFVLGHSYVVFRNKEGYMVLHTKCIKNPCGLNEIKSPFTEMLHLTEESESYGILASVIGEDTLNELIMREKAIKEYIDITSKAALN